MSKKTFGQVISEMRKEKNWTQLDLAEKMGVTDKAVSKWERDLSYPDVASLPKLAEIFNVSVDDLMQVRSQAARSTEKMQQIRKIVNLILTAIPLAMGVAVLILSILKELDMPTGFTLIAIGLISIAIRLLQDQNTD